MPKSLNALAIRRRLGRGDWAAPVPYGPDGWSFVNFDGKATVILSCFPWDDGLSWIHASIAHADRLPSYAELTLLHDAVFGDGWAYQVFAPEAEHVNLHRFALHLWGRLDGQPVLPNFAAGVGSI